MDSIARKHALLAKSVLEQARVRIRVLILGPYHPEKEKQHLINLKDALQKKGIRATLLEDHTEGDELENFRFKFDIACMTLRDSDVTPIICSYLPKDPPSGPLSELTNIVDDPEKYELRRCFRIFAHHEAKLPHHSKSIPFLWYVKDGTEFTKLCFDMILREAQNIADGIIFQGHRKVYKQQRGKSS